MKAIRFHQHGGPEVLKYEDAPEPVLRANEVLVRVKACALNRLDLWVRIGSPNVPIPLPHIPGSDVAGRGSASWNRCNDGQSWSKGGARAGRHVRKMRCMPFRPRQSLPPIHKLGLHDRWWLRRICSLPGSKLYALSRESFVRRGSEHPTRFSDGLAHARLAR